MALRWLQLKKPMSLEMRHLKDYSGQPLIFKPPGFKRRCVTDEVFNHPDVQTYIARQMIEEIEVSTGGPPKAAPGAPKAATAPKPAPAPPAPAPPPPEPKPEPKPEPTPEPEPASAPEPEPEPEPTSEPEPEAQSSSDSGEPTDSPSVRPRRRRKR